MSNFIRDLTEKVNTYSQNDRICKILKPYGASMPKFIIRTKVGRFCQPHEPFF